MRQQSSIFDIKIQFYHSFISSGGNVVFQTQSSGETTINDLLKYIQQPPQKYRKLVDRIRGIKDKKERDQLKTELPGFIIQSYGTGIQRNYDNLINFTGLTVLDFDGEYDDPDELKQYLFDTYPFIVAAFKSPSGKVKCIIRMTVCETVDQYQDHYRAIISHFGQYDGFDPAYKNGVLITFYTYDQDILIRENPTVWTWTESKPEPLQNYEPVIVTDTLTTTKRAFGIVGYHLNKIVDNGHPQLISASKILGGYVGGGYLTRQDAEQWIHSEIERHPYLCKDVAGYQKTASQFIHYGMGEPLNLPD